MRVGQVVARRYRLEEQIGSGGMGVVWRATDTELHRTVAVKRAHAEDEPSTDQIRREARITAQLHHPHVVTLFDVVLEGEDRWLVMEYVPSRSLAALLDRHGHLPAEEVARIGEQIASALQSVHADGILHRDVKPGNVLVTDGGVAKLTDFGISRTVDAATLTGSGLIGGTPAYLSPEVADGGAPTPASDVASLGATLFAAVEGDPPYGRDGNPLATVRRAARGEVTPPRRAGPLAPLLLAMLHVDPARRPTAAQARQLLQDVAAGRAASAVPPRRRARRLLLVAAGTAVAVGIASAAVILRGDGDDPPAQAQQPARIDDPRTADPCALTDPDRLSRFGETELDNDFGNFNRCDVLVTSGESDVDVRVELDTAQDDGTDPPAILRIERQPEQDGECERLVVLHDRGRVFVTAEQNGDGTADLCAMADVATATVRDALRDGAVPRRAQPFDDASLATVDACGLLAGDALRAVPGLAEDPPDAGFAGWECRWSGSDDTSVLLRFDRDQPLDSQDGTPVRLAGHQAFVQAQGDGPDTCLLRLVHRTYQDQNGRPAIEMLFLVVSGPHPADQLCGAATDLASAAAAGLPAA